jgi:hypothetical protein
MTEPNFAMIRKVISYVEDHPQEFDMSTWRTDYKVVEKELGVTYTTEMKVLREKLLQRPLCNTTMCAAGTAVFLANIPFWGPQRCVVDGKRRQIEDVAQELMGLTDYEAHEIFYSDGDVMNAADLRQKFEEVLGVEL